MSDYELKRIINLTEASSYGDADYLAVDGANGTKKLSKETLVKGISQSNTLTMIFVDSNGKFYVNTEG